MMSVYDRDRNLLLSYPRQHCPFCAKVREIPELERACIYSDHLAFDRCDQTGERYVYHCHMGLVEVATPLVEHGRIIGYLLQGQFSDCAPAMLTDRQRHRAEAAGLDGEQLQQLLSQVAFRDRAYVQSLSQLAEMCACYLWLNDIVSVRSSRLAYGIEQYIADHLADDLSVETLSRAFSLSPSALYKVAVDNFGTGISSYVSRRRMEHAGQLLRRTDHTVMEVAAMVGYEDYNYFTKVFRRYMGQTPKRYQLEGRRGKKEREEPACP